MSVQLNPQSPISHQTPEAGQSPSIRRTQVNAATAHQDHISSAAAEPSCCSTIFNYFQSLIDCIRSFFKKIFQTSSSTPVEKQGLTRRHTTQSTPLATTDISSSFHNNNKLFAYQQLLQRAPANALHAKFTKYGLGSTTAVAQTRLLTSNAPTVHEAAGTFTYDPSTEATKHWTANFADRNLFGFGFGALLAQDELQILEHPGLYQLKMHLRNQRMDYLGANEIALIENVLRLGNLDTQTPLPTGATLYGNTFAHATQDQIASKLTRLTPPHASNIFAMPAPHISASLHNQPYQKQHLEQLFYTCDTAFSACKENSGEAQCVVHTGKWGAGAFGNDPKTVAVIQIAAAMHAGIDELRYYALGSQDAFIDAQELVNQITLQHPQFTVDEFLSHLADNAAAYGLRYGLGNGT